ncbi:hypothetical protein Tco_1546391 [Tanacetum coccineum]
MEDVNPSSLAFRNELSHLEKKMEIDLWLENNGSVDSLVSLDNEFEEEIEIKEEEEEDDLEYFDTFPTIEELGFHEWLLKNPRPSWVSAKHALRTKVYSGKVNKVRILLSDNAQGHEERDLEMPRLPSTRPGPFLKSQENTGKLGRKWEGPYEVIEALGKGAYKLRNESGDILPQTWNV